MINKYFNQLIHTGDVNAKCKKDIKPHLGEIIKYFLRGNMYMKRLFTQLDINRY